VLAAVGYALHPSFEEKKSFFSLPFSFPFSLFHSYLKMKMKVGKNRFVL